MRKRPTYTQNEIDADRMALAIEIAEALTSREDDGHVRIATPAIEGKPCLDLVAYRAQTPAAEGVHGWRDARESLAAILYHAIHEAAHAELCPECEKKGDDIEDLEDDLHEAERKLEAAEDIIETCHERRCA